jgi:hypothetical protein
LIDKAIQLVQTEAKNEEENSLFLACCQLLKCRIQIDLGNKARAEALVAVVVPAFKQAMGTDDASTIDAVRIWISLLIEKEDGWATVKSIYERYIRVFEETFGIHHKFTMEAWLGFSCALSDQEEFEKAAIACSLTVDIGEKFHGPDDSSTLVALNLLGTILFKQQDYHAAKLVLQKLLAILEKTPGFDQITEIARWRLETVEASIESFFV